MKSTFFYNKVRQRKDESYKSKHARACLYTSLYAFRCSYGPKKHTILCGCK